MRRARKDGGQSTVELALVLPFVCLLILSLVQVGLVVHAHLLVVSAAREGARAAAVDDHPMAAQIAVVVGTPLDRDHVEVHTRDAGGSNVEVEVGYTYETDVPLIGALIGDIDLSSSAEMRREWSADD